MFTKVFLVCCTQALVGQIVLSQRFGCDTHYGPGFVSSYGLFNNGRMPKSLFEFDSSPTRGGNLPVVSSSSLPTTGLYVASENVYEGFLNTVGELPFVGTLAVQGSLPTSGSGSVSYGCGNGNIGIVAENWPTGVHFYPNDFAPGILNTNIDLPVPTVFAPSVSYGDRFGYGNGFCNGVM